MIIRNVHLPANTEHVTGPAQLYSVVCVDGRVHDIELQDGNIKRSDLTFADLDADGRGVLLPALCHGHIHLDKCFLLDKCDELVTGDFSEALRVTANAKSTFPLSREDLYGRGKRLIMQSIECGVTMMRAHVEVDSTVHMACIETGLALREEFQGICEVQIAAFAQDPLFTSAKDEQPGENLVLLRSACQRPGVQAVGSVPYVEPSMAHSQHNITLILDVAYEHGLHADFHLDYNVDPSSEPLIWYLLDELRTRIRAGRWHANAHVCIGHATRLTLFSAEEWTRFRDTVDADHLPVTLVGLPPSDLYMMGRQLSPSPRTTLDVPRLAREYGLKVGMAVNNVENAFTPQGPVDPLALCPLGIAVFQAGTRRDCWSLLEAVTVNARQAIGGFHTHGVDEKEAAVISTLFPAKGDIADFVLLHGNDSAYSAALNPSYSRTTIKDGVIVARRHESKWMQRTSTVGKLQDIGL
ncbi:Metallo-dependent hydrolase [Amylocystis lapponica]|nr:Metallo-dependent hydrolase [Amylocystis lapponica]